MEHKNDAELSEPDQKINKLWALYDSGDLKNIDLGIYILCDYESGVNAEGHSGWFFNTANTQGRDSLSAMLLRLEEFLPANLYDNLNKAFQAFETENEDEICDESDQYFYEHEKEVINILQDYANKLSL